GRVLREPDLQSHWHQAARPARHSHRLHLIDLHRRPGSRADDHANRQLDHARGFQPGPDWRAGGRVRSRRDAVGDDPLGRAAVRAWCDHRRRHAWPRPGTGETIAVVMIISPIFKIQLHVLEKGTSSVSSLIALRYAESTPFAVSALMAAGLALFALTLL